MFTGIIKEIGIVRSLSARNGIYTLRVEAKAVFERAAPGDSVAVNGVCLTVTGKGKDLLTFDAVEETLERSDIGNLREGHRVNLEDALRTGDPLGGHFVSGHVDCPGTILSIEKRGGDAVMEVGFPVEFSPWVVDKGSIALDGVGLTVGTVRGDRLTVHLIPHTLRSTTLGDKRARERVNIEFDLIGKYISKMAARGSASPVTEDLLRRSGFLS
ncbi:MAG: riboflavin synthase [Candidatus Omnitrophota bacterium]